MTQNNISNFYNSRINTIVQNSREEIERVAKKAYKEYFPILKEKGVDDSFERAVNAFYSSYTPGSYRRNYSLDDILITTAGDDYITIDLRDELMTTFRNGKNGLYELVFKEGYHGGAKSGEGHPDPGTPYWRNSSFTLWGRPAEKAPVPPYEDFVFKIQHYVDNEGAEEFRSIWDVHKQDIRLTK